MRKRIKMKRMITVILTYLILITFIIPVQGVEAKTKRKEKNIENGYIYRIAQYENNFLLEYDSPVDDYRKVKKHNKQISKTDTYAYPSNNLNSRYVISYDDVEGKEYVLDLKEFVYEETGKYTDKAYDIVRDHYGNNDNESIGIEIVEIGDNGTPILRYDLYDTDGYKTKKGIIFEGKIYEIEEAEEEYQLATYVIDNYALIFKEKYNEYDFMTMVDIINLDDSSKETIELYSTAGYTYIEKSGDTILCFNDYGSQEVIRYEFSNGKLKKIGSVVAQTTLTADKNGDIWSVDGNKLIKYENGQPIIKEHLDREYTGLYIYDENRYVVDNRVEETMKVVYPDLPADEWKFIDGEWYYYENGVWQTGWKFTDGTYYYLGQDGAMRTGWQWIDNAYYYFDGSGRMQEGFTEIDGSTYYLGTDGAMRTGWQYIDYDYYYFNYDGTMKTGWFYDNGAYYWLDEDGRMARDLMEIDGVDYYFDYNSGVMVTGWIQTTDYDYEEDVAIDYWMYADGGGALAEGWKWIDNNYYYFNNSNYMMTGWQKVDDKWYYLSNAGTMTTGWQWIDDQWYSFSKSGDMHLGWQWIDNAYYYFGFDGNMRKGWQWIDNAWYYFTYSGNMITNQVVDGWYIGHDGVANLA